MIGALLIYGVITLMLDAFGLSINGIDCIPNLLNPVCIYKENKVNIFGCIMLAFIGHIFFPWYALPYWLCVLCTIGRR